MLYVLLTPVYTDNTLGKHERRFRAFKEFVRQKIDLPMFRWVFPVGTVLRDVRIEISDELRLAGSLARTRSSQVSR